jgi:hypothetical protein
MGQPNDLNGISPVPYSLEEFALMMISIDVCEPTGNRR